MMQVAIASRNHSRPKMPRGVNLNTSVVSRTQACYFLSGHNGFFIHSTSSASTQLVVTSILAGFCWLVSEWISFLDLLNLAVLIATLWNYLHLCVNTILCLTKLLLKSAVNDRDDLEYGLPLWTTVCTITIHESALEDSLVVAYYVPATTDHYKGYTTWNKPLFPSDTGHTSTRYNNQG